MEVDTRGMTHPDHIKEFKKHIEGLCAVYEDIDVIMDNSSEDRKKMESYLLACRAKYTVEREDDHLRIKITAPFYVCG